MHWSKSDTLFTALMLSLLGIICTGINVNLNRRLGRNDSSKPVGFVKFKNHQVLRKYGDRFAWESVSPKTSVYAHDAILTREESDATVSLNNGLTFEIDANTMIEIEGNDVRLKSGSIQVDNRDGEPSIIKAPDGSTLNLKKGKALIQYSKNGLEISVTEGSLEIKKNGKTQVLTKQENILINNDNKKSKKVKINLIASQPPNYTMYYTKQKQAISFTWQYDNFVYLLISKDPLLKKEVIKVKRKNKYYIELNTGLWYWRLSSLDTSQTSPLYRFKIRKATQIQLYSPADNYKFIKPSNRDVSVAFRFSNTHNYTQRLTLARDKSFSQILLEKKTNTGGALVPELMDGHYFWRVSSKSKNELPSQIYSFLISSISSTINLENSSKPINIKKGSVTNEVITPKSRFFSPVYLTSPAKKLTLSSRVKYLSFRWSKSKNANAYIFKIANITKTTRYRVNKLYLRNSLFNKKRSWSVTPIYLENNKIISRGQTTFRTITIFRRQAIKAPLIKRILVRSAEKS